MARRCLLEAKPAPAIRNSRITGCSIGRIRGALRGRRKRRKVVTGFDSNPLDRRSHPGAARQDSCVGRPSGPGGCSDAETDAPHHGSFLYFRVFLVSAALTHACIASIPRLFQLLDDVTSQESPRVLPCLHSRIENGQASGRARRPHAVTSVQRTDLCYASSDYRNSR